MLSLAATDAVIGVCEFVRGVSWMTVGVPSRAWFQVPPLAIST